ncbi:MAG TPA: nucleotidyl transferase AbiEii/AbiGii toxin family protein [Gammaproteobacteria bacterium]|nr:nucleotidyl transferase AbiEii/AbiGii toxin family protein [Gammaproteobacteria bacterium]
MTLFREAVTYTAAQTGFDPRLIEKDYFCSLVLQYLAAQAPGLVFKGGTCLAKVHAGFYRLSEDLDFSVPMPEDATRAERSRAAKAAGAALAGLTAALGVVGVSEPLRGANESKQYVAALTYKSLLDGHAESIKIEIGLREPLLESRVIGKTNTLLLDPVSGESQLRPFSLACLSAREAMAEKARAALARLEPAIRDFFDIDHAALNSRFNPDDKHLLALVRQKLAVRDTGPVDMTHARLDRLRSQIETDLRPVLRPADFAGFDLDRAFALLLRIARAVGAVGA